MGNGRSSVVGAFRPFSTVTMNDIRRLNAVYAQRGFDFVLDVASLDALVYEATTRHADASMVEAFGSGPLVNAMEFLCGVCVCARGEVDEKASVIFEAFDFARRREMSLDELTIAFICTCGGAAVVAGHSVRPTDRGMEQMARRMFADVRALTRAGGGGSRPSQLSVDADKTVSHDQVQKWIVAQLVAPGRPPPSTDDLFVKFGMSSAIVLPSGPFPVFPPNSVCLMSKILTRDMYEALSTVRSQRGFTLDEVIQSGVDVPSDPVGAAALDESCYSAFAPLLDGVLTAWHAATPGVGSFQCARDPDAVAYAVSDKRVLGCRVAISRNLGRFALLPGATRAERREVERLVAGAVLALAGDLRGAYFPLAAMPPGDAASLREARLLPARPRVGEAAFASGAARDWPEARGVFATPDRSLVVHVNARDHVCVIGAAEGGDFPGSWSRAVRALGFIEAKLRESSVVFAFSSRYGYITACPSDLGCGTRASATLNLKYLSADGPRLDAALAAGNLVLGEVEGAGGVRLHTASNKQCLGTTEAAAVLTAAYGAARLAAVEKALATSMDADAALRDALGPPGVRGQPAMDEDTGRLPPFEQPALREAPTFSPGHTSQLALTLSSAVYMAALGARTSVGGCTIAGVTRQGVEVAGAAVGAVAGDEECYDTFAPVFDPIVRALHGEPRPYTGDTDASSLAGRLSDKFVRAVRVRVIRNVSGYALPAAISRSDRRDVERLLMTVMAKLTGDELSCKYYPLYTIAPELRARLVGEGAMFPDPADGSIIAHSGGARDWPDGRGVFHNDARTLLVWVNEQDHVRVIGTRRGANLGAAFEAATRAVAAMDAALTAEGRAFSRHPRLGYVTACPSSLGSGLRASAVVELPQCARQSGFEAAVAALGLSSRAHPDADAGVGLCTLSTVKCMGVTEVAIAGALAAGVGRLCELEAMLQAGVKVDIAAAARAAAV